LGVLLGQIYFVAANNQSEPLLSKNWAGAALGWYLYQNSNPGKTFFVQQITEQGHLPQQRLNPRRT
jgi:hypothetical protein